ncbi:hypothetical protein [Flavobacterium sp. HBTb2-11-1]|uniref:hypothetical protein n=1 Tax=Flavobacterium sp. HBTb2-11-1 TaxID=2692212 RepID=UPI00136ABD35|nr:hypothetical protein [Flavobacterium sp. HBTb2-11-1]MXO05771.1 hypothetical protein [Flavobacterium sp. HBTb2-11-1]
MSEENSRKSILDYTSIVTIGGILLYQLGWSYWETYLNNFNIDSSLIDISIEKIISTTWTTILLVLLALLRSIEDFIRLKKQDTISVRYVILYLVFGIFLMYESSNFEKFTFIHVLLFGVLLLSITLLGNKIDKLGPINKKSYLIILIVVAYIMSAVYYPFQAKKDSTKIISDRTNNVLIVLKDRNKKINGKFITFMNDKYFILVENKFCKRETRIFSNSEINYVVFPTSPR